MATTNLHLAKTPEGQPLKLRDIQRGTLATFPSGAGGIITTKCTECTDTYAVFESTDKDWPTTWTIETHVEDLSLADFNALSEALKAYDSWNESPTDNEVKLVRRAAALGYVSMQSATQVQWLERGLEVKQALVEAVNAVEGDDDLTEALLTRVCPPEDAYELRDILGDMTLEEKHTTITRMISADALA